MALFPLVPVPSHVSPAEIIDPSLHFMTDSGIETRRALHSRPRRRFTMNYLGKSVEEMRTIRDFLQSCRFGAGDVFQWAHPTAYQVVTANNTTPITLTFPHEYVTGQWINIGNTGIAGVYRITRVNSTQIALDGTNAQGTLDLVIMTYLPYAVARFSEDTMPAPETIIGPDQIASAGRRSGFYSFSVTVEEVF
jgi:hypothetical protein